MTLKWTGKGREWAARDSTGAQVAEIEKWASGDNAVRWVVTLPGQPMCAGTAGTAAAAKNAAEGAHFRLSR